MTRLLHTPNGHRNFRADAFRLLHRLGVPPFAANLPQLNENQASSALDAAVSTVAHAWAGLPRHAACVAKTRAAVRHHTARSALPGAAPRAPQPRGTRPGHHPPHPAARDVSGRHRERAHAGDGATRMPGWQSRNGPTRQHPPVQDQRGRRSQLTMLRSAFGGVRRMSAGAGMRTRTLPVTNAPTHH
eukprot:365530-Chlamydomonas_euryale.AAC.21